MKTLNQAAKEYQEANYSNWTGRGMANELKNTFIAGSEYAHRWIPVEEELPGKGERILIKDKDYGIQKGYLNQSNKWLVHDSFELTKVVGWRPIELK